MVAAGWQNWATPKQHEQEDRAQDEQEARAQAREDAAAQFPTKEATIREQLDEIESLADDEAWVIARTRARALRAELGPLFESSIADTAEVRAIKTALAELQARAASGMGRLQAASQQGEPAKIAEFRERYRAEHGEIPTSAPSIPTRQPSASAVGDMTAIQGSASGRSPTCGPINGKTKQDLSNVKKFCEAVPDGVAVGAYAMESLLWVKISRAMAQQMRTDRLTAEQVVPQLDERLEAA